MATMYQSPEGHTLPEPYEGPKAHQACMSCRKQKRKCSKALPACALCERMNRHCDYSDSAAPPNSDDFTALQLKVMELESRLNGGSGVMNQQTPYSTPTQAAALSGSDSLPPIPVYTPPPQDLPWQGVQNRFPAIAFLDSDSFKYGGIAVPRPSVDIPNDALEILGDGIAVQGAISDYFATVHKWMPIVSQVRLTRDMASPLWEAGPDLALLFLSMKLIISRPQDGVECAHNPVYLCAKRFVALMEATGTVSLLVLQANLLVTWYEYGQAIYPAAWMSAGWCLRYANMLGINGHDEAAQLLGQSGTFFEQEERRRTWWGVLLADRIVSLGSQGHIINSQEPQEEDYLPADDAAWDNGERSALTLKKVSNPVEDPVAPFPRLCQASNRLGRVYHHHWGATPSKPDPKPRWIGAGILYTELSLLARTLHDEISASKDYLSLTSALALTYSGLCILCDAYSSAKYCSSDIPEAAAMQAQAIDGLKTVSQRIVDFSNQINNVTPLPHDLDEVSPIIMDALYNAAANYAWLVRESGDENSQLALDSIRFSLRRLGSRWRNAAEYLRILEAREFTYAVGSAGS